MVATVSVKTRRSLPWHCVSLLLLVILVLTSKMHVTVADEAAEDCDNPDKPRMISAEELATKDGKDGTIWISVVGEVYDVTAGKDFYGPDSSYNIFAGRDSSVCFVTGAFTVEEGSKGLDTLEMKQLGGIESWRGFYEKDDKYPFIGLLIDPRYYDENGNATPALEEYRARLKSAQFLSKQKTK